jgi:hypothetical protein
MVTMSRIVTPIHTDTHTHIPTGPVHRTLSPSLLFSSPLSLLSSLSSFPLLLYSTTPPSNELFTKCRC